MQLHAILFCAIALGSTWFSSVSAAYQALGDRVLKGQAIVVTAHDILEFRELMLQELWYAKDQVKSPTELAGCIAHWLNNPTANEAWQTLYYAIRADSRSIVKALIDAGMDLPDQVKQAFEHAIATNSVFPDDAINMAKKYHPSRELYPKPFPIH